MTKNRAGFTTADKHNYPFLQYAIVILMHQPELENHIVAPAPARFKTARATVCIGPSGAQPYTCLFTVCLRYSLLFFLYALHVSMIIKKRRSPNNYTIQRKILFIPGLSLSNNS